MLKHHSVVIKGLSLDFSTSKAGVSSFWICHRILVLERTIAAAAC